MERQQVRQQLEALHAALRDADRADPEARELMRTVLHDIQRMLDEEPREREAESLVDRLRDALDRFEGEHPQLAEAAGRVIDQLSQLGI